MATTFKDASWKDINAIRDELMALRSLTSVEDVAQAFCGLIATKFSTVVLARTFLVLRHDELGEREQIYARKLARDGLALQPSTKVLTLLGTMGQEPAWCARLSSQGHAAIPLIDLKFVQGIPMVAKLLSDLDANLAGLNDDGLTLASRRMQGGINAAFFVPDAVSSVDSLERHVISAREFVTRYGVRSVFGMGGAYVDGRLAITIVFTSESLDRLVVDRFPSLISNFKMATAALAAARHFFAVGNSPMSS